MMSSIRYATGRCCGILILIGLLLPALGFAGVPARKKPPHSATSGQKAAQAYEVARANPLDLHAFLARMPKGAELHYHLYGGVYAETWIRDAAEDGLCIDIANHALLLPMKSQQSAAAQPVCGAGQVPASNANSDQNLYDALIDAFSMRSFVPRPGVSGHDHFFDTFEKFDAVNDRHAGEWLDEIASRAAAQNEQYLELMETPDFSHTAMIARQIGWHEDLAQLRSELLARGLSDDVAVARQARDRAETSRRSLEHCGTSEETPACKVTIRYLYQILRGFSKEQVFAQTLLGFEVASADPRFVGINYVMPEDGKISMEDYGLHMKMVGFLHGLYPKVHISLHAGELAEGLVTPDGLCCHIRLAVEGAHAERIGHGVDVMQEDRPYALLREMAAKHVMVEINLTSNDVILGVSGKNHPFPIYRQYHVPVSLSTDDEGVSRIDMTHEFVRAAQTYRLSYGELKELVRTGLDHTFLPGPDMWASPDAFTHVVAPCAKDRPGAAKTSAACDAFLKSSEKAQQEWNLERRFRDFEAAF